MAQQKVSQPVPVTTQPRNPNIQQERSVFNKVSMGKSPKFKDAVWPRHGTETMAQLGRLLRGKLPK